MAIYSYEIGDTYENMVNIEDLGLPPPSGSEFEDYSVENIAGNGLVYGDGYPTAQWPFDILSQAAFNALCNYVNNQYTTGASAQVYIKTKKRDGTYATYTAIIHQPKGKRPPVSGGYWRDVTVEFTHLEVYTP
jgi:hypothetical protein